MATKRIKINKSNGTSDVFNLVVPDKAGTYNIKFNQSNGGVLNAGNITVDGTARTYRVTFGLSNGGSINAGTFTTPVVQTWHTIFSGSTTIATYSESGATKTISGLRANTKTRITFSGGMTTTWYENEYGNTVYDTLDILPRADAESSNGVYSSDVKPDWAVSWMGGSFGFSLTMKDGYVEFKPYVNYYVYDYCANPIELDLDTANVTITKIEQYY